MLSSLLAIIASCSPLCGADWLQFRGNDGSGVSAEADAPTKLEKEAWKAPLPGKGLSGPIIVGNQVFLTSSSGVPEERLHVLCFDVTTGNKVWERQFWATGSTMCHSAMAVATPTPASDGKRIFASYSSNDVACLDLEGNLLWYRGLTYDNPNASNSLGMSSSPIVADGVVIMQVESDAEAFTEGLDAGTGIARWKIERPRQSNWTSPIVLRGADNGKDLVLLQSSKGIAAVRSATGEVAWTYSDGASTIPSSTLFQNVIFVPSHGVTALKPTSSAGAPEIQWRKGQLSPGTASPLAFDGRVFTLNNAGVLVAAGVNDGEVAWRLRLKGKFSGSPIAAAGKLYAFNEEGVAFVVELGEKNGKVLSELGLKERVMCTPAIAGGNLYVRSDQHLWKFGQ
ncbi:MAG: PQQ-binding-like beta-propeller repeat protein [Planctomycetaceae bacterium]